MPRNSPPKKEVVVVDRWLKRITVLMLVLIVQLAILNVQLLLRPASGQVERPA